MEGRCFVIWNL